MGLTKQSEQWDCPICSEETQVFLGLHSILHIFPPPFHFLIHTSFFVNTKQVQLVIRRRNIVEYERVAGSAKSVFLDCSTSSINRANHCNSSFVIIWLHLLRVYIEWVRHIPAGNRKLMVHSNWDSPNRCPTLCDPMNCSTPGLPVLHQLPEFTQTHVHWVSDAIQPSHPLSFPSPPANYPSQHQSLFQWVNSSHEVPKVLEFQL